VDSSNSALAERRNPVGRKRSEASRAAILEAAIQLLEEVSLRDLTIEALAREAGVSKATIYRWWPSKTAVVIEAFVESHMPKTPFPEGTTAVEALTQQVASLIAQYREKNGRMVAAILAEGQADPRVLDDFRQAFFLRRRTAVREVVARGMASGEFDPNVDIDLAIDLIYAPIYFRLLVGHQPLDDAFARALPALALRALRPSVEYEE